MAEKPRILFRRLHGAKYVTAVDYQVTLPESFVAAPSCMVPGFIEYSGRILKIRAGYAWDGASGPTWDSNNTMRPSLLHDVGYQLLRLRLWPQTLRLMVDVWFRDLLVEDGMSWFRSRYYYTAVRMFGGNAAKHKPDPKIESAP